MNYIKSMKMSITTYLKQTVFSGKFILIIGLMPFLAIAIAYFYFQNHLYLMPCVMCVTQRYTLAIAGFALIGCYFVQNNIKLYWCLFALAITGFIATLYVAGRQVWLQSLPEHLVPACGPSFDWMVKISPLGKILQNMFLGNGSCADVSWSILGISIPGWVFIFTLLLVIAAVSYSYIKYKVETFA